MERRHQSASRVLPLRQVAERWGVPLDDAVAAAARRFPLRFPADYLDLVPPAGDRDIVRLIGWPDREEVLPDPDGIADPVGERALVSHPLVIRKYDDRVILLLTSRCHFYCRFCFRAGHRQDPSLDEVRVAIEAIAREERPVREVILSGGDPLVLSDTFLAEVLRALGEVRSLETIRIHTRAPVHEPRRVTEDLVAMLADAAPVPIWVAIHITHPRELHALFDRAVGLLRDSGIPLLSQTVLLGGVNDDARTLAELFTGIYRRGIKPYYLHHPDRVPGTARFRVSIDEGRQIVRVVRGLVPGPAMPFYVLDLPDGRGKVPVDWLVRVDRQTWRVDRGNGAVSTYVEPLHSSLQEDPTAEDRTP